MKSWTILATATLVLNMTLAFAAQAQSSHIDCSKGASGIVVLTSNSDRLSLDVAVLQAYSECLLLSNTTVQAEEARALAAAGKELGPQVQCHLDDPRANEIRSWISGRGTSGETNDQVIYLIQRPVVCGPTGTGLFEGTVANAWIKVQIDENFKVNSKDNSGLQKATIQILGISSISTRGN